MKDTFIHMRCNSELKRQYVSAIKKAGFRSITEPILEAIKKTVARYHDPSDDRPLSSVAEHDTKSTGGVSSKKRSARSA